MKLGNNRKKINTEKIERLELDEKKYKVLYLSNIRNIVKWPRNKRKVVRNRERSSTKNQDNRENRR